MATTKVDLLRDILTDAFINLDFDFDLSEDRNSPISEIEFTRGTVVDDMISVIEEFDQQATKQDFTVKVIMDKKLVDTPYGDRTPEENKGSIVL